MTTVVCQSFRTDDVPAWMTLCMESVRNWALAMGWEYRFMDDALLELAPDWYREKARGRVQVVTDLARLVWMRSLLEEGAERAIWIDADVVVFAPERFRPDADLEYAFGGEVWVQPDARGAPKARRNVHNAFCLFRRGNSVLDFYIHACERIVGRYQGGPMVPQLVGPKLLGGLHNLIGFPLVHQVGMASPMVVADLHRGGGPALERLLSETPEPLAALNLCGSLVGRVADGAAIDDAMLGRAAELLLRKNAIR